MNDTRRAIRVRATGIVAALVLGSALATPAFADAAAASAGFAGSSGTAGTPGSPRAVDQPPNSLPGIDVSHYQNTIDWSQVAASGVRFAFQKATDGRAYVDPTYAVNRAAAEVAGIVVGAYHFARPDGSVNDAIVEADHFVDTAQPQPGELLPVLDVEKTGGLDPAALTTWILTWLGEVASRTGVHPIVYTSPKGWASRTGDTTAAADAGFTTLWIAHWNVQTPSLPANDWQGFGWRFWQYSNCGSVPGIQGCVDLDWFNGTDLGSSTVGGVLDTLPPSASLTTPTGVVGATTVSFSEPVRPVTPASVVLRASDTGEDAAVTISCAGPKGAAVDCATGKVMTAVLQPDGPLVSGETYGAIVNPPGASPPVADLAGNLAPTVEQDFSTPIELEQGSPAVVYGWRTSSSSKAYGGSYAVEHLAGAFASFDFSGTSVTWFTVTGPSEGEAAVSIDGRPRGTFNQYTSTFAYRVSRSFHHLQPGAHTITVRVLGKKGSSVGSDTRVAIDAFRAGGKTMWTPELQAGWQRTHVQGASDGSVAASDLAGASATLSFRGTGVQWATVLGPDQGRAKIYVDGALVKTVDGYAKTTAVTTRSIEALAEGVHVLRVVVFGQGRPAATDTKVTIDGFAVIP